jgi:3',5'-cyclic AMP phosphodiesterase CpdA
MKIVHISDLHCGENYFAPQMLEMAIREINGMKPDIVVITGDLTWNGLLEEYGLAKEYLDKLECKRLIVGGGNHDYKLTGFLLLNKFFPRPEVLVTDNAVICYISTSRPDRDVGEVGHRQLLWLRETMKKYKTKFKVVAMHHHLVPIPDTGTAQNLVMDAGDVLKVLIESGVNLVLCGHKHRPWKTRIEDMCILNAGSVSSRRLRGFFSNSYNIIDIRRESLRAELKIVGGRKMDFEEILKGYDGLAHLGDLKMKR